MLRLVIGARLLLPNYKSNYISQLSCFTRCLHSSYSFKENGSDNRAIDVDLLFHSSTNTHLAKRLHALLIVLGKVQSLFISTRLVNLYSNLGNISLCQQTFDQIPNKDVYTWNSIISAYVRNAIPTHAVISCLYKMLINDVKPDFYTFPPVLKACRDVNNGSRIHALVSKTGLEWDVFVAASLVHMYCRFGLFDAAYLIFTNMPFRDKGCWNAIISGFSQNGKGEKALEVLDEMRREQVEMDSVTVSAILPVCAQMDNMVRGRLMHLYVVKHGLESDLFVGNAFINFYAKFGEVEDARKVFDSLVTRDLVSWNSIIAGYEQNNDPDRALKFFREMQGFKPDLLTLVSVASGIAQSRDIESSRCVHGFVLRRCWFEKDVIIGNAVIDMYAKLGNVDSAWKLFDKIGLKDVVSWNTMITGYGQNGLANEAVKVYRTMIETEHVTPNQGTWASIIPAYAHIGAIKDGAKAHGWVLKTGLLSDVFIGTCLIDLYGKCGKVEETMDLFYEVPKTSSVPWNAVISCLGIHGQGETSLKLFKNMLDEGVRPDAITFISLLSACSHSGLVEQGEWCFDIMQHDYGIKPSLKHYGCLVDLLGRAGQLEKAYNIIKGMPLPLQPDASVWGALLGACRIYGNADLGKVASDKLLEVDPDNVGYYVLLSNIYANAGKWDGVNTVRSMANSKGLKKTPGWSSIELNNKMEVFYTGNQSHPQCDLIYEELENLTAKMKILGYIPDYSFVLQDVEEDEKQHILTSHSERLAIAYGIINTPARTPIRIFKNLRVCGDCHNATKFISRITEREIIVRDSNRFHNFKDGVCSCGDYW